MTTNPFAPSGTDGLPRPSLATRCAAIAAATVVCCLLAGSQLGLVAHYTGETDALLARLLPSHAAAPVVASASRPISLAIAK
jgi:hypothetical protein